MTVDTVERMDKIKLPPLSLNMLTKSQLCDLIPHLIQTVTGTDPPHFTEELRPLWWPDDIPWTTLTSMLQLPSREVSSTELRRIVRCCYYHSGNEKLLASSDEAVPKVSSESVQVCPSLDITVDLPLAVASSSATKEKAMGLVSQQGMPSNFSGHFTRGQRQIFNAYLKKKQQEKEANLRKLPLWDDSKHPVNAWWAKKCTGRAVVVEPHPSNTVKQEDFLSHCGLVTSLSAVRLKHEAEESHENVDLDCQIIAVEGPLSAVTVTSPRTPRSLISQLSRDSGAAAKKRISFCVKDDEGSGNDSESNAASSGVKQGSLLNIDFSSYLGQRLKKHMQSETTVPVIKEPEMYCQTDPRQNDVGVKLRHRASDYPVTFRKKKSVIHRHCHTFKLTGGERREFLKVLKTGLDKRSRRLQRLTKNCVVKLVRLTRSEIRYWTIKRRTVINQEIQIDDDISIMQVDIPESSFSAVCHKLPVSDILSPAEVARYGYTGQYAASYTFQDLGAPDRLLSTSGSTRPPSFLYGDRAASPPWPQFLVKKVSKNFNGQESQRLVYVPLNDATLAESRCQPAQPVNAAQPAKVHSQDATSTKRPPVPAYRRLGPKSRRKRLLSRKSELQRNDNDITIESSNSSDEDSVMQKEPEGSAQVHPVSVVDASGKPVQVFDVQSTSLGVVPRTLHVAQSVSGSASVSENSASTFLPQMFPITEVTLLPGQDPSILTDHQNLKAPTPTTLPSICPSLAEQLQIQPVTPAVSEPATANSGQSDGDTQRQESGDGELTLSIGAVYSAADLCNLQLASSLGFRWVQASPGEMGQAQVQPPNFLLSPKSGAPIPAASPPPSAAQQPSPHVQQSSQQPQPPQQTQNSSYQPCILQPQYPRQQPSARQSIPVARPDTQPVQRSIILATPMDTNTSVLGQQSGQVTTRRQTAPLVKSSTAPLVKLSTAPLVKSSTAPLMKSSPRQGLSRPASAAQPSVNRPSTGGVVCEKTRPLPVELPPVPPPLIKRLPPTDKPPSRRTNSLRAPSAWQVVNAVDDDVVEVICIDD